MNLRRAIIWSLFWVLSALAFAGLLVTWRGPGAAQLFLAGYVVEKSLSIDNLIVFAAIFSYFQIPLNGQPKILYLGFIGAALFRLVFLATGAGLMTLHPAVGATFGAIVIGTAVQMLNGGNDDSKNDYQAKWFVKLAKKISTTPAFLCLVAIEVSDIIFSFDSMPAVLAITADPLIVYSAVIFAILGLRSMYFVLAALMTILSRLTWGVVMILFFIGTKLTAKSIGEMAGTDALSVFNVGPTTTLWVVFICLAFGVIASILWPENKPETA